MTQMYLSIWAWIREGLRAGIFLRPRVAGQTPRPAQLAVIALLLVLLEIATSRLEIPGPAIFNAPAWLAPWWATSLMVMVAWWTLSPPDGEGAGPSSLSTWFALWLPATVPANLVSQALSVAQAWEVLPAVLASARAGWALYALLWAWTLGVVLTLTWRFVPMPRRVTVFGIATFLIFAVTAWQFPGRYWQADPAAAGEPAERFEISQETFEKQQSLWKQSVEQLAPRKPGVTNVWGLVFAPYAREDVFLRESTMVAKLLAERFDAQGRVLHLLNNPATADSLVWATPLNLGRAIEALGARMDRESDLLVVYMTSHGASDFKLAADHAPLSVEPLSPGELREVLDKAGIKNRVIAISACFSGGWLGPLAGDSTLVMTAADPDHTSYGCGRLSELTFFGRAVFDEQLRKTHSFEAAFDAAVPVIQKREVEAGKNDGFSNPQILTGAKIQPLLQALAKRLDEAAPPPATAKP